MSLGGCKVLVYHLCPLLVFCLSLAPWLTRAAVPFPTGYLGDRVGVAAAGAAGSGGAGALGYYRAEICHLF